MTSYAWFVRGARHAALCRTSMAAVKKADPKARLVVATDEAELSIPGAEMIRFEPGLPLMVANIEAQLAVMWAHRTPIVFLDTDVLFLRPFPEQWEQGLTITWRNTVGGEIEDIKGGVAEAMPYNFGVVGALPGPRVIEAWIWMRERIRRMAPALQLWWGNQIALSTLAGPAPKSGIGADVREIPWRMTDKNPTVNVTKLPGELWNYTPRTADEDLSERGAVHFKGHTRGWMQAVAQARGLPWHEEAA